MSQKIEVTKLIIKEKELVFIISFYVIFDVNTTKIMTLFLMSLLILEHLDITKNA